MAEMAILVLVVRRAYSKAPLQEGGYILWVPNMGPYLL